MLGLRYDTPDEFVARFEDNLEAMLLDHAHCEKKAASTALMFIGRYPEYPDLVATMAPIVEEEMLHFRQVLALMSERGWAFRGARASTYAGRLHDHVRRGFEDGFVDRMLVAALIEARSCERFSLLGKRLGDRTLAEFYASLFESEARHYSTYLKLALARAEEPLVRARLDELLDIEADTVATGDKTPHLHA